MTARRKGKPCYPFLLASTTFILGLHAWSTPSNRLGPSARRAVPHNNARGPPWRGNEMLFHEAQRKPPIIDPFGRAITYLRVSVTDRCDFRCVYCMSENM